MPSRSSTFFWFSQTKQLGAHNTTPFKRVLCALSSSKRRTADRYIKIRLSIFLQPLYFYCFQLSLTDRVLLYPVYFLTIILDRTAVQHTDLHLFFCPDFRQTAKRDIVCLCNKSLLLIVLYRLTKLCFCFRLALCSGELLLCNASALSSI